MLTETLSADHSLVYIALRENVYQKLYQQSQNQDHFEDFMKMFFFSVI